MHASWELKKLLERKPSIDVNKSNTGSGHEDEKPIPDNNTMDGSIEFQNVTFSYPSRTGRLALDGFNLRVEPGESIALVGPSGCGKSTVFSLIERFYDADSGAVLAGGKNVAELDLVHYRSKISLVSQDPVLYTGTIRENITMGVTGKNVSDEEIIDVCKQANIWDFVASLQEGLSSLVGPGGCMLSGGQKQRISIARALIRRPQILLLDEATSALDTESEARVQTALDRASEGKTTISIAHRLSTVQKANSICVLEKGKLVELGNHDQLLAQRGRYWEFVSAQNLR